MSTQKASRLSSLRPMLAVAAYAAAVVVLLAMAWSGVADILDRRHAIAAASDLLAQLEGRKPSPLAAAGAAATQVPTGSPFLEGQTLTLTKPSFACTPCTSTCEESTLPPTLLTASATR